MDCIYLHISILNIKRHTYKAPHFLLSIIFLRYWYQLTSKPPSNYRPISLTCVCCKIMEHIVTSHIIDHAANNEIENLDKLATWEHLWEMKFHPDKCTVLTVSKKKNPIIFDLHNHTLAHEESTKYLGCTITSDLNWGTHISNIF